MQDVDLAAVLEDVFKAASGRPRKPAAPKAKPAPKPRAKAATKPKAPAARTAKPKATTAKPKPTAKPKVATTARPRKAAPKKMGRPSKAPSSAHAAANLPAAHTGGFTCHSCGGHRWREHHVHTKEGVRHATLAFAGCTNCGALHVGHVGMTHVASSAAGGTWGAGHGHMKGGPTHMFGKGIELADLVGKEIDASETALQAQDLEGRDRGGDVGHRTGCPKGGSSPCGAEQDGKCGKCGAQVQDHYAVGKSHGVLLDLRKLAGLDA